MASNKSIFRLAMEGVLVGHPIHVMVVHFPIGLWGISLIFDLAWATGIDGSWLLTASRWTMAIGTVFALIAGLTGVIDWLGVRRDHPAQKTILIHMALNVIATGLYLLNTLARFGAADPASIGWIFIAMSMIGYGLVMVSGYFGGVLIYDEGIGVGRHRKETTSPQLTITSDHTESMERPTGIPVGYTVVAQTDALPEDGTLRVKLSGHEICLIRSAGRVYAVQEYCTHRYGPLSEGALHNGCLECPWHNSCFNVSTGEVVSGPAKEPLRTYTVQEIDGVICVQTPIEHASTDQPSTSRAEASGPPSARGQERDWERPSETKQQEAPRKAPKE